MVYASGHASQIAQLGKSTQLSTVLLDEPIAALPQGDEGEDPVPFTEADTAVWTRSLYGFGEKIGYLEASNGCKTGEHEFFGIPVIHSDPAPSCAHDSDCWQGVYSAATGDSGACIAGQCYARHGTSVGSIIAQIAPAAQLYMANKSDMAPVSFAGIESAFEEFQKWGVTIVNESFAAEFSGAQGIIEDDLARSKNILVTVASGNHDGEGGTIATACPHNVNGLCVGAHAKQFQKSCFSNWKNSGFGSTNDREEPDILALGGNSSPIQKCNNLPPEGVRAARLGGGAWSVSGTSFAAPAVAASAALLNHYCRIYANRPLDALSLRAALMAGATRNSLNSGTPNYRYSTPHHPDDWFDGAGILSLGSAVVVCDPSHEEPGGEVTSTIIDLTQGDPSPANNSQSPQAPPEHTNGFSPNLSPLNQANFNPSDGRRTNTLLEIRLKKTARLRFVLSWNACRRIPHTDVVATPDFDLFLYNKTRQNLVFASQSFADNNEGFDVDVFDYGDDGDVYDVIAGWLPATNGATTCPDNDHHEPVAFAYLYWGRQP